MAARAGLAQAQSLAAQYVPGAQALWLSLQVYFQVNNNFVIERLKTLLFPFRKRKWARHAKDGFEQEPEAPVLPVADPNAPDLYIPCMALVTFVLLTGVAHGTQTQFTPETLVNATSAALVTQLLELGALRLGLFLAAATPPPLLDLVALGGYKYVGIVLSTLAFLLLGSIGFYVALLYTSAAMAFFLVQTLQAAVPPGTASNPNRNYAILAAGGLQPLIMWWLASQ